MVFGETGKAANLFGYVAENCSDGEFAFNAQLRVLQCAIKSGSNSAALQAFDELWKSHSSAKGFVERAVPVCESIFKDNGVDEVLPYVDKVLEGTEDIGVALRVLKFKAECCIDMGDEELGAAVQEQIDLHADKDYYPDLQLDIAYRYRKKKGYKKANVQPGDE